MNARRRRRAKHRRSQKSACRQLGWPVDEVMRDLKRVKIALGWVPKQHKQVQARTLGRQRLVFDEGLSFHKAVRR